MAFKRKNVQELQSQLQSLNKTTADYGPDENEWKPTTDAQGNGSAVIRFLDATEDTPHVLPYANIYNHGFKEGTRWFIENCPTTLGKGHPCPVCEANGELWGTEIESNKNIARRRKRKLSYWANILVIKDAKNPTTEGKVLKYRFGQKIMDKILAKTNPDQDLGLQPENPACVFEGSNFVLKVKKVPGQMPNQFFPNYDDSQFQQPSELFANDRDQDAELERIEKSLHDLTKINGPAAFKSYDELKTKFEQSTGGAKPTAQAPVAQQAAAPVQQAAPTPKAQPIDNNDDELDTLLADLGI